MDLPCASLLLLLIGQAQGATYFLYLERNEAKTMDCKQEYWQIDFDYDHKVDCNETIQSPRKVTNKTKAECKEFKINRAGSSITVQNPEKKNGFLACGDSFQLGYIYPFKSPDQSEYFILAFAKPDVLESLPETRKKSHINIHEGESIILTCNFSVSKKFRYWPYVVYWIRTSGNGSTCLYSYEYENYMPLYNSHCFLESNLLSRVSDNTSENPMENPHLHHLTINNSTHSDSGHYVCALNVRKENRGNWVVISNVTVTVSKKGSNQNTTQLPTGEREPSNMTSVTTPPNYQLPQQNTNKSLKVIPVFLVVAIIIIGVIVTAIYVKRKRVSPYAVAEGEFETYSEVKLTAKPEDHGVEGEQTKPRNETYTVVRMTPHP